MHNYFLSIASITLRYILVARQQGYLRILFNWFILVSWLLSEFTSCVTEQILPIECYITIAKENRGQISGINLLQVRCGGNQELRAGWLQLLVLSPELRRHTQCKTGQWCKFGGIASFLPAMRTRSGLIGSTSCAPRRGRHPRPASCLRPVIFRPDGGVLTETDSPFCLHNAPNRVTD